jgi:RNA polymerase sigma-70 factor (ECF subfamily)
LEWLQPFPDTLLDPERPEEEAVARETIELVFLTAIQHLSPQQRAVFVFRDVLGWSAADTAAAMDLSVASVNSALQRAKSSLRRHLPEDRSQWRTEGPTPEERKVLDAYLAASRSADLEAVADLLTSDVVLTMPPNPFWFAARDAMMAFVVPELSRRSARHPTRYGWPACSAGWPTSGGHASKRSPFRRCCLERRDACGVSRQHGTKRDHPAFHMASTAPQER